MKILKPAHAAIRPWNSILSAAAKYWRQVPVGRAVRWGIGAISLIVLTWLSAGIHSGSVPWQFIIIMTTAGVTAIVLISIPRSTYSKLFSENFGWLTVALGLLSYPYWHWVAGQYSSLPSQSFFEISAQILPVLLLAAIIDVRQSATLNSYQLVLPIIAAFIGESTALSQIAFQVPSQFAYITGFSAVSSSFVIVFLALIFAVLADIKSADAAGSDAADSE
jgi:hypothetical protein